MLGDLQRGFTSLSITIEQLGVFRDLSLQFKQKNFKVKGMAWHFPENICILYTLSSIEQHFYI